MDTKKWTEHFKRDLPVFYEATRKFYRKELEPGKYKGISGGFGCYGERGAESTMLRLRFAGGIIEQRDLQSLITLIEKHKVEMVHYTTCQSLQLHHLTETQVLSLTAELYEQGILTRGAGSDFPRNITAPALRGIDPNEYFDITALVDAVTDYLLGFIGVVKLPRKFKVSFNNAPVDEPHSTIRDLGFVGRPDGLFDVYAAGGLGPNPKLGVKLAEGIAREKILYYVKAMYMTFSKYGNYTNRSRARTRYFQQVPGTEEFKVLFNNGLTEAFKENLELHVEEREITKTGIPREVDNLRIKPQKQRGLYYVTYHPVGGTPSMENFLALAKAVVAIDGAQFRLGAEETAYITNLTADEAERIAALTESETAHTAFEKSVSCVGSTVCQVGLRDSHGLLKNILEAAKPYNFADGVLPRLYISGCPNSCGTHETGVLGFQGAAKKVGDTTVPAFAVHIGGSDTLYREVLGPKVTVITSENIPEFIVELGKTVENAKTTFNEWYSAHSKELYALAEKYV